MFKPTFSIIIPTYNSSEYIKACLLSLISQTFENFEIIIIDGLSTDNTIKVCNFFEDKRIKILSEKDNGIYDAMNKGIKLAKGDWLYFLGSDDSFYSNQTLALVSKTLLDNDIVYGNVLSSRFDGKYDGQFDDKKIEHKNICHQAIFLNKKVFNKIGNFNIKYISHADWDHNLRWFFSEKIKNTYVDLIIANYADGGFSSYHGDHSFAQIKTFKIAFLRKSEISFAQKLNILQTELRRAISYRSIDNFVFILISLPKFLL